jgi:hexosaminidase
MKKHAQVIPTPNEVVMGVGSVDLNDGEWSVVFDEALEKQAKFLASALGMEATSIRIDSQLPTPTTDPLPPPPPPTATATATAATTDRKLRSRRTIRIRKAASVLVNGAAVAAEAYRLVVDADAATADAVEITATDSAGAFYGAQSLLQLMQQRTSGSGSGSGVVPSIRIADSPRFEYRGFSMDVSRNFRSKEDVLAVLEVMGEYKLNKLHFHLTDDEGRDI